MARGPNGRLSCMADMLAVEWTPVRGAYRAWEGSTLVGTGARDWERAAREVLHWGVKTSSGFSVDAPHRVFVGQRRTIIARIAGVRIPEPVVVTAVVETADRVGFSYRTLPGHPVSGEEAFLLTRTPRGVVLTVRSLTAPSDVQPWRAAHPLLRIAQLCVRRRYLRALRHRRRRIARAGSERLPA